MPSEIGKLAAEMLRDPERVSVSPPSKPADKISQCVQFIEPRQKVGVLAEAVAQSGNDRVLVFTRTKRGADRVVRELGRQSIAATAIHGNKSQGQRVKALAGFKDGKTPILVATDIAARGIDVDGIDLVVNYDLPHVPETYVHRIGRTARAGRSGSAIAFCCPDERPLLKAIEKLIGRQIPLKNGEAPVPDTTPAPDNDRTRDRPHDRPSQRPKRRRTRRGGSSSQGPSQRDAQPSAPKTPQGDGQGLPAFLTGAREKRPSRSGKSRAARRRQRRSDSHAAAV